MLNVFTATEMLLLLRSKKTIPPLLPLDVEVVVVGVVVVEAVVVVEEGEVGVVALRTFLVHIELYRILISGASAKVSDAPAKGKRGGKKVPISKETVENSDE